MEQHPIPQNISSYEFRLVGDMTLKQFFQLSAGIIVGLLIYRLPLINILKFPLIFFAVFIGIALAFIPINNRPFSRWIVAFIHAIYSPTEYVWRLSAVVPSAIMSKPKDEASPPVVTVIAPAPIITPVTPVAPPPIPVPIPAILPSGAETLAKAPPPLTKSPTETTYVKAVASPPPPSGAEAPAKPPPTTVFTSSPSPSGAEAPSAPSGAEALAKAPPTTPLVVNLPPVSSPQAKPKTSSPLKAAPVASQLTPPSIPNILSGLITDPAGNPLDTTIVEIIDSGSGIPARALRSNRLGQFQIATPLKPGNYIITAEKDNFSFEPVSLSVADQIINPIVLTGTAV